VVDSTAGSTTTTSYVGSLETYSITTGNQPTNITTTDYLAAGKVLAESVNGTLSYLATSYQGSVVAALDSTGNVGVTASQLYVPYGGIRYQNGALPTDYGYTGQRRDASTGLDYYGARYYDPTVGQFTSADTILQGGGLSICGLNRYAYVKDNPETLTDPSGNCPQRAEPHGWAKVAKVGLDVWALISQLLPFGHNVGSYSGTNRNGGGSPEYGVEATYDPNKNVASADPPPDSCDDGSNPGTRTIQFDSLTGEVPGLEPQASRAARRDYEPPQEYGRAGENGIRGAKVQGKNAGDPKRLRDGSWTAHLEAIDNADFARSLDASPWQQHLIDLNDMAPIDPGYVSGQSGQPGFQFPDIPWIPLPIDGAPSGVDGGVGGYYIPPLGGYGGAGQHL
jgi:RHS repeat-associated protein